ncbi:MAG: type II/IV secretion system protein [Desulfobacteraceae bacterium]|nr:type II/IV secretion system protein [Desulfobacteraceae bacterium]
MAKEIENPFSPDNVCKTLFDSGLITEKQKKGIMNKKDDVFKKLEARRAKKSALLPPGNRIENPITIIDVISSLNLKRKDRKAWSLDEEIIFQVLTKKWGIPYKKIDPLELDLNVVTTTIPKIFALKHLVLPVEIQDGVLTIATPDPFNLEALQDVARATSMEVKTVVSPKTEIIKLIEEFFGFKRSIAAAENEFDTPSVDLGNLEQYVELKSADELPSNDLHIVNAVNHLFIYAFDQRASDIHIEPKRDVSLVRMRIDGVLHTVYKLPKKVHFAIISRIKNLSRLDMAEKRRPQDGRIKTDKEGVEVEMRISTLPVAFGEKIVMRIMDPDILFQDTKNLGFTTEGLDRFNRFVNMPHGIGLVTGPTGSGKSTTLYSTLRRIATPEINVTTIEDPIEMVHEEFNQIAVQPAVDITFSSVLRYILRQDPDIIMIGEMRDLETAENAIQAALTGHLVLSTLHTNDAPSSITRLIDLGVPAFLIQASLVGILAQRLVRTICEYCKEPFEIESEKLKRMGLDVGKKGKLSLNYGKGCVKCRGTGYKGRKGIFEVLPYTEGLRKLTTADPDMSAIKALATKEGMVSLRQNGIKRMMEGTTTYKEILRVTWDNF